MNQDTDAKILIVDNDAKVTSLLQLALSRDSYEVEVAHSAREGLRRVHAFQPDLVLMDLLVADLDGWDLLRQIRQLSDVPLIILTTVDEEEAKVRGLNLGADDYVIKTVGMEELVARIEAALRRAALAPEPRAHLLILDGGGLVIDPAEHQVTAGGRVVSLTPTEYKLLLYLAYNAGRILTPTQIAQNVWGPGYDNNLIKVKVCVRRLRKKIEPEPDQPRYIMTERGSGYCLAKE